MTADFFQLPGALAFAIEDHIGPIMFIRVDLKGAGAAMHIQFDEGQHRRTAVALSRAFPIVRDILRKTGVSALTFDSVSPSLVAFCQKRLGFTPLADSPDHYIAVL